MTGHAEAMRLRGRRYLAMALTTGIVAIAFSVFAHSQWFPAADSNSAFMNVHVNYRLLGLWNELGLPVQSAERHRIGPVPWIAIDFPLTWVTWLLYFSAIPMLMLRKVNWLAACLCAAFLLQEVSYSYGRRHGNEYAPLTGLTASALDGLFSDRRDGGTAAANGRKTDVNQALVHYTFAQHAYGHNDVQLAKAHLEAIDAGQIPRSWIVSWRIVVMQEWTAANGAAVSAGTYVPFMSVLSIGIRRIASRAALALAVIGYAAAVFLLLLTFLLNRRARRIDAYLTAGRVASHRSPETPPAARVTLAAGHPRHGSHGSRVG